MLLSTRQIYNGQVVKLRDDTVRIPDGGETTREIVEHSDCIAIIAIDDNDNVLLGSQFRQAIDRELLEIPAGGIEADEDPLAAMRRELREETGFLPRKVERLGGFYSAPGYCSEYLHLYLATNLTHSPLYAEDTEGISLVRIPISEIPSLIAAEKIIDAKSIAGLLTFLEFRKAKRA